MNKRNMMIAAAALSFFGGFASGQDRFDMKVREEFFAGFAGDEEAMVRAIRNTESILVANPKHAEALVWHGAGLIGQSGRHFREGNVSLGSELYGRGQKEMDAAAALEPENLGVRIIRGAVLMSVGRNVIENNPERGLAVIAKALVDYEYAYSVQKDELPKMGEHPVGELLIGIADANSRAGNTARAAEFFDRIQSMLPNSVYAKRAATWKATGSLPARDAGCIGCHTVK